ncbi:PTS glucitol/sorbitol transporter subunit IIA [Alkalihalobacillus sp. BA299]|uniref:PTS glucitol/sorbitol transporter subunit IIA n=1 Tax=Alkalihalobacillus sp. BA299 TaxID=2815938 RepID=UPI001ADC4CF6|nr:PTS glucitol/sorbitol transporter subunit IIA [Alkalihalobacillus sp. BA299]
MELVEVNKYQSLVTEVGSEVELFIEEKMIVIFNENAPEDLRSIGVIHKEAELLNDVEAGDFLEIDRERFEILFVGNKVNDTLKELGHCTIAFNGEKSSDLPGTMCVEHKQIPEIKVGSELRITKA